MKIVSKITLAASLSLALGFTFSCSSDGGGSGQGDFFNENSQVYKDDKTLYKGNAIVKLRHNDTIIDMGNITNGIVKLEPPTTIPDEYLDNYGSCEASPKDAKFYYNDDLRLFDNNEMPIGALYLAYIGIDYTYFVVFLYSSKAAKVTCEDDESKTDIDAKAGWNKVYVKKTYSCNECDAYYVESTNDILSKEKEMKWIIQQK